MRGQVTEIYRIFDSRDRELVIPVYQRNYDWKPAQCRQLLDDLKELVSSGRPKHFFGAVVGKPETAWEWVVIDGQQRLTTVSLLMLALSRLVENGTIPSADAGLAHRLRSSYLVRDEAAGQTRFKLKPVKDDAEAYRRLFGQESEYIEKSNVTANYRFFLEELPKLGLTAEQIWSAIERLEVMHLDLESSDDPQRIFESLNSTGLALSEADKVRNLVLMGLDVAEQNRVYEDYWNRIEKSVDYDTDDFLRWYLTTKTSRTPRIDRVYEEFKKFAAESGKRGAELLSDVRDYADYYRRLGAADTGSKDADAKLRKLNILRQDVALPFLMPLLGEYQSGALNVSEFVRAIDIVESYLFRRFICGVPTNGLNKIFATLFAEIRKLRTPGSAFADVMAYSLRRREASGVFPDDDWFAKEFAERNMYNIISDRRRYLFECLENGDSNDVRDIANALEDGALSVEHVMPQTLTEAWRAELSAGGADDPEAVHSEWLHRIGNLTVTGYNSSYSSSPYQQKRTAPNGFLESPFRLNREMKERENWNAEAMQARSDRLTRAAVEYWDYPETDFQPPKPKLDEVPMGTDTDFTNRIVVRFQYEDSSATVRSWRELLVQVLQMLLVTHREKLYEFTGEAEWLIESESEPDSPYQPWKVEQDLWVLVFSSTFTKVVQLRRLFAYLGLDPDDLIFTLRPNSPEPEPAPGPGPSEQPYADLTKFIEPFAEFQDSQSEPADTADILAEFRTAFAPYMVPNPPAVLQMAPVVFAIDSSRVDNATPDQILALVSGKFLEEQLLNPAALHESLIDGSLTGFLNRLAAQAGS